MMLPQVGVSGGMPMPRKESTASIRIALAQTKVPCTISAGTVFGRMWRTSSTGVRVPAMMAASTYGSSRTESTIERTRRTTRGISGTMIATMTLSNPARNSETSAIASRIAGIAISPSISRITMASTQRM
jgi:hypothetical protein